MELVPIELQQAALGARDRLVTLSRSSAAAEARGDAGARLQEAMAATARGAIFADALLGALRARLEELRVATK